MTPATEGGSPKLSQQCEGREPLPHQPQFTSQTLTKMRKIEQQMNDAITNNLNWQSANTSVTYCKETNESKVYLHGNHIATVGDDFLQVFDGCLLYTSPSPRDLSTSRMPSSA